jgi:hypothetical protein
MSDKLAELIIVAANAISAHVNQTAQTGGAKGVADKPASAPAKPAAAATGKPAAPAPAATAAKPAAAAKPALNAAQRQAAKAAAPAPTKAAAAQAGKYSEEQIREIVRRVVATTGLGKQSAFEVLQDEGGVQSVGALKPADYDKVYEACNNLLTGGEGGAEVEVSADAAEDEFDPTA